MRGDRRVKGIRGSLPKYDYYQLHKDFNKSSFQTLHEWVDNFRVTSGNEVNYTQISRNFARIDREIDEAAIERTRRKFARQAPTVADQVILDSTNEDSEIRYKNNRMVLEAVGVVGRNENKFQVQNNVIIPALFAQAYTADAERMLGGTVNLGTGEDSSRILDAEGVEPAAGSGKPDGSGTG